MIDRRRTPEAANGMRRGATTMASEPRFLAHDEIGPAIRHLMRGGDVRCAVAFWGAGAANALFGRSLPRKARLVCDISMGCTRAEALEGLGAPGNARLKHVRGLHATVYLSDRGAIVGSANASHNGIGFAARAALTEAATFHPASSTVHRQASAWFDRLWAEAEDVDEAALGVARLACGRAETRNPLPPKETLDPLSLIDLMLGDPDRFRGVGFVFTSDEADEGGRDETATALIQADRANRLLSPSQRKAIRRWRLGDTFTEWSHEEIDAWPGTFVCAHRSPRGRIRYYLYRRAHWIVLEGGRGMLLGRRDGRALRGRLRLTHGLDAMAEHDAPRLERCFAAIGDQGHRLAQNSEELSRLLHLAVRHSS